MPSKSKAQHNLMAMVAHDPKAAKRLGIPQSVGRDYVKADKGRKFDSGGMTMPNYKMGRMGPMAREEREMPVRRRGMAPMTMRKGGEAESPEMVKKEVAFMKKKGAPKSMIRHEEEEIRGGGKGKVKKFAAGSSVRGPSTRPKGTDVQQYLNTRYYYPNPPRLTSGEIARRQAAGPQQYPNAFLPQPTYEQSERSNMPQYMQDYYDAEYVKGRPPGFAKGGKTESKKMMKKEAAFMKAKGAPKAMVRHEEQEMGGKVKRMKSGGPSTRVNQPRPGSLSSLARMPNPGDYVQITNPLSRVGIGPQVINVPKETLGGKNTGQRSSLNKGWDINWVGDPNPAYDPAYDPNYDQLLRRGGKIKSGAGKGPYRHAADGVAHKGKTKGHVVKMREGGVASSFRRAADGIASKGKTKGKMVKMRYGGEC